MTEGAAAGATSGGTSLSHAESNSAANGGSCAQSDNPVTLQPPPAVAIPNAPQTQSQSGTAVTRADNCCPQQQVTGTPPNPTPQTQSNADAATSAGVSSTQPQQQSQSQSSQQPGAMQMQTPMQIQNKSEQHPLDATFASCAQQMQMQMQHQQMVQQKQQQQQQQFLQFQQQLQLLQSHASPQSPAPCPAPTPTPQAPPSQPTQTAASNDLGILPPSSVATRAASAAAQLPLDPQLQQLLQQLDAHALQQLLSTSQEVLFQSTGSQTSSQHQQLQLLQQLQQHLVIQQQQAILQQQQKNEQSSENHSQALSKGLPLNHAAQHEQIQKNLLMLHQQQSQQLQQLQQQQQQLQQKQLFQRQQQQLQQMYQQTAHQIVSQPSPQQSQTVQPVPPPQASPPSLQSPQVSQTFQHQSMPQNAPQQTQQTTPQPQTPPPQQSPQQTIYQSQQLPQQTVSLPFGSMSFNKQNTQQTSAYAPQLCSSPQQQMQTAQSTTATHTGTLQLQCNDLPTILKLCEAVGQYVSDSNQHKIDWNHISRSMPWSPSECQAVWRHIAYSWKPEDVTGSTLNTTELDGNESDEEQLLKSMHPKVLQPSPQIQPQMDTSYTKILQPTGNYLPKQEAEEPPTKKRKRKVWKPEDDVALLDAVELYGESNWPYLAQQLSHLERSHSQLSSRYTALRKKAQKGNCGDARIKWKLDCIAKKSEKQS